MDGESKKKRARRRALRAAQVVTIAFALGTGGCSDKDGPGDASSVDSAMADSSMMDSAMDDTGPGDDAGSEDAGSDDAAMNDSGPTDDAGMDSAIADSGTDATDGAIADASVDVFDADRPCSFPPTTMECCTAEFCTESGSACFWDEESGMCLVAVPGPFVPPAMA